MTTPHNERVENFIEKGAAIEHKRWSGWQEYFFSKCQIKPQHEVDGMDDRYVYFALPKDLYERWLRQIATPYEQLSEPEKESDRREVRSYLPLLETYTTECEARGREEGRKKFVEELFEIQTMGGKDEIHCSCLPYALVTLSGEEGSPESDAMEARLKALRLPQDPLPTTNNQEV